MKDFFQNHKIEYFSLIPLKRCKLLKPYLLEKNGFTENDNVILFLIPYRSKIQPKNLTVYASVKDYHGFVSYLDTELSEYVKAKYPQGKFKIFADHSPIDEVYASCISGLGFIGDNGLLINEKYSSFVFLAECVTSLTDKELGLDYADEADVKECLHCGACQKACPSGCIGTEKTKKECLSAITQKKGDFTSDEERLIIENGSIWGCDVCQNVCPYTKSSHFTPIDYFNSGVISLLDKSVLDSLSDEEFMSRPFSWRGRSVIERNVNLYERSKK